jgi:hypothetical protein
MRDRTGKHLDLRRRRDRLRLRLSLWTPARPVSWRLAVVLVFAVALIAYLIIGTFELHGGPFWPPGG